MVALHFSSLFKSYLFLGICIDYLFIFEHFAVAIAMLFLFFWTFQVISIWGLILVSKLIKLIYNELIPILSKMCDESRWLWRSIQKGNCSSGSVLLLSREIICLLGPTNVCNWEVCEELDLSESSEKLSIMAWFKCISNYQNMVLLYWLEIYQYKFIYKTSMSLYTPFTSHKGKCSIP